MIRNLIGTIIVVIGACIFRIGFNIMPEDTKDKIADKFVEKLIKEMKL
jgi:hypothetical protein